MDQSLAERLHREIAAGGPIPVSTYMGQANAAYYAARDPLGAAGDFVTAPEISQMFGELVGLWLADLWLRAGRPKAHYVELGPGRGTLAADALRAMRAAGLAPDVHLVETSPVLRAAQAQRLAGATWHDDAATLPETGALLIVANEFFDALPVRQTIRADDGWRERVVTSDGGRFVPRPGRRLPDASLPPSLRAAPPGTIVETAPAAGAIAGEIGRRLAGQGGAALIVDYGHLRTRAGETLQAVGGHRAADPWQRPGEVDLTAHVDFEALAAAAMAGGAHAWPGLKQGAWLGTMGIDSRAAALIGAQPARAGEIAAARDRLTGEAAMGRLFKVLMLTGPAWPCPAGAAS